MIVDFNWNAGIVVGIQQEPIWMVDDEGTPFEEPSSAIHIHLTVFTITLLFP